MLITQLGPTLCNPMDYSPPGSSVLRILQARILEWVVISFSRGSSWFRDRTQVSCTAGRFFSAWPTREAEEIEETEMKGTQIYPGSPRKTPGPLLPLWPWPQPFWSGESLTFLSYNSILSLFFGKSLTMRIKANWIHFIFNVCSSMFLAHVHEMYIYAKL